MPGALLARLTPLTLLTPLTRLTPLTLLARLTLLTLLALQQHHVASQALDAGESVSFSSA